MILERKMTSPVTHPFGTVFGIRHLLMCNGHLAYVKYYVGRDWCGLIDCGSERKKKTENRTIARNHKCEFTELARAIIFGLIPLFCDSILNLYVLYLRLGPLKSIPDAWING